MGADLTADISFLQGLILQDPRFTAAYIDDSQSSAASQADPVVGHAIAQQDTNMVLSTSGSQSAEKKLRIYATRAGHPGTDKASTLWYENGEEGTDRDWRGWTPPQVISDFEFADLATTSNPWSTSDVVATDSGRIVVAGKKGTNKLMVKWRDPSTGTWSEVEVFDNGSTFDPNPALLVLPDGQLRLFFWVPTTTHRYHVRMYHSDDDGSKWSVGQYNTGIDIGATIPGRLRAVYHQGQVLCIAVTYSGGTTPKHGLRQYASADLGATFSRISDLDATGNSIVRPVVLPLQNSIVVAYVSHTGGVSPTVVARCRILGTAYDPIAFATEIDLTHTSAEWGDETGDVFSGAELAGYVDEDNSLYLFGVDYDSGGSKETFVIRSIDGGETWTSPGNSATNHSGACLYMNSNNKHYMTNLAAVSWRGRGVLIHTAQADPEGTLDLSGSLMCSFLGGHSSLTMPPLSLTAPHQVEERASFNHTWLPFLPPDELTQYTKLGSAAAALVKDGVQFIINSPGIFGGYRQLLTPTTPTTGAMLLVEVLHTGDSGLDTQIMLSVSDGGTSFGLGIEIDDAGMVLKNAPSGALTGGTLATTGSSPVATTGMQVLLAVQQDSGGTYVGRAWYRAPGPETSKWVPVTTNALALTPGADPQGRVVFKTKPGFTGGSATARYKMALLCDFETGGHLVNNQPLEDKLGRTVMPTPVWVDDGVSIQADDGPSVHGDIWHIDTRYTYGYRNTDPRKVASPQLGWRTLNDDSDADLVWQLGEDTADEHGQMGAYFAMYLGELNWRTGEVWARSGATWTKILDIDTALTSTPTTLSYTRKGFNILPDLSGLGSLDSFLTEHTLEGCTWDYGDNVTQPRKIATNTSGAWTWSSTATVKPPRLLLESYATADPGSGSTGRIWSKEAIVVLPRTLLSSYDAVRLRVKAQTTADGDLRTGVAMVGWMHVFAQVYSQGRGLTVTPNNETTTGRNGVRTVRNLGRNRRAVEFDWTAEPLVTQGLYDSPAQPDYWRYLASSGEPVAHPAATASDMMGAYARAMGSKEPVVYVARAPDQAGPGLVTVTLTNRELFLYGRLMSDTVRIDAVEGDEWSGERPELRRVNVTLVEGEV